MTVTRERFDYPPLLRGAIKFYHEALHIEGLYSGCKGRGGPLGSRLSVRAGTNQWA